MQVAPSLCVCLHCLNGPLCIPIKCTMLGYRSGNSMKSFDVVNVLSQRYVCREIPVEEKSVTLNGQANVLLMPPSAYLGEKFT